MKDDRNEEKKLLEVDAGFVGGGFMGAERSLPVAYTQRRTFAVICKGVEVTFLTTIVRLGVVALVSMPLGIATSDGLSTSFVKWTSFLSLKKRLTSRRLVIKVMLEARKRARSRGRAGSGAGSRRPISKDVQAL